MKGQSKRNRHFKEIIIPKNKREDISVWRVFHYYYVAIHYHSMEGDRYFELLINGEDKEEKKSIFPQVLGFEQ